MSLARSTARGASLALLAAVCSHAGPTVAGPAAQPSLSKPAPAAGTEAEARCTDDSTLRLKLLDEKVELRTRYGTLTIPATDIRRIEFATRTPADVAARIDTLISNLNHPDFALREKATAELRDFRDRAYLPLVKAAKHTDPEISKRAEELMRPLQARLPAALREPREFDVIHTDDSKFTGKLAAATLKVLTAQFGEQNLRVADLRGLRTGADAPVEEVANAPAAPPTMMAYANQFGKELTFRVTYPPPVNVGQPVPGQPGWIGQPGQPGMVMVPQQNMAIWGTDVYTLDSGLAGAAAHAGLVQHGGSAVVRVRIVPSPNQFFGSNRHGVTTMPYGPFQGGAFEFVRK